MCVLEGNFIGVLVEANPILLTKENKDIMGFCITISISRERRRLEMDGRNFSRF